MWIRRGNASTETTSGLLRTHAPDIDAFIRDSEAWPSGSRSLKRIGPASA
ncbi:MAG: hypothetical protein ABI647_23675 [Gemmatimonadota bacterium]